MKATILSGLIALALGAFTTSCSNILEENSVLNSAAQSGMGELRINLTTDASLNVSTKGGEGESEGTSLGITLSDEQKKAFKITGTSGSDTYDLGNISDYENEKAHTVPAKDYSSITASNEESMTTDLAFDTPTFKGTTSNVTVTANGAAAETSLTAYLTNSVITIDETSFTNLKNQVTIDQLYVTNGQGETVYPLVEGEAEKTLTTKKLYVKAGINNAKIVLKGKLTADETRTINVESPIGEKKGETMSATTAKRNYKVSYTLSDSNGSLKMTITINDSVTEHNLPVNINPYESNTNSGS